VDVGQRLERDPQEAADVQQHEGARQRGERRDREAAQVGQDARIRLARRSRDARLTCTRPRDMTPVMSCGRWSDRPCGEYMTPADLVSFLRLYPFAVQASVTSAGAPQAAVVGVTVTDELELVFDTLGRTRKAGNLRHNPRIAFVVGGDDATVQYDGVADEPAGTERDRLVELHLAHFPERRGRERLGDLTYFRVRPLWIRYTRLRCGVPEIVEWRYPVPAPPTISRHLRAVPRAPAD
jgi:hypothetical protein